MRRADAPVGQAGTDPPFAASAAKVIVVEAVTLGVLWLLQAAFTR